MSSSGLPLSSFTFLLLPLLSWLISSSVIITVEPLSTLCSSWTKSTFGSDKALFKSDISNEIFGYLLSALFCVHFKIIFSMLTGTLGKYSLTLGTLLLICFKAIVTVDSPSKGTLPVSISNIVMPSEYMSLFSSTYCPPACSGEI